MDDEERIVSKVLEKVSEAAEIAARRSSPEGKRALTEFVAALGEIDSPFRSG